MVNFPTSLDTFVNPTRHDQHNASAVPHYQTEADQNDAIEELEKIVGGLVGTTNATPQKFFILEVTDDAGVGTGVRHKVYLRLTEGQPQFFLNPTAEP